MFNMNLAVPEQAKVCNGCMLHIMKPLDVSSMLKPKKLEKLNLPINGLIDPKTTTVVQVISWQSVKSNSALVRIYI
jgi:hypothetical protein